MKEVRKKKGVLLSERGPRQNGFPMMWLWLFIPPSLVIADPGFPGTAGRTKMAFPMERPGFLMEPVGFACGFGKLGESSFQALDAKVGLELGLLPQVSVMAGLPLYLDHCSDWAFGAGDLLVGAGLRWRPWSERSTWLALFPFITAPTGRDGYSVDSLRQFSTEGLDYGVICALSAVFWERNLTGLNIGAYNPNQARGYGSHTNQVIYRALWLRRMADRVWLGPELSGEWFFVNRVVPEASHIAGGSPMRLTAVSRFTVGMVNIEISPGIYLTNRRVLRGDSLVYPRPIYTLPVGDIRWEIIGRITIGNAGLEPGRPEKSPAVGGVIAGRVLYPDSTPAVARVELPAIGMVAVSDSTGRFAMNSIPPDSYMVLVSGQFIASVDPLNVIVVEGETTSVNLVVQRASPGSVAVILRDMVTKKELDGLVMLESISNKDVAAPKTFYVPKSVTFPVAPGAYVITGKADGYFAQSIPLTMADKHNVNVVIDLIPQGFTLEFPGVLFDFGSARIKKEAYPVLDSIASVIRTIFAANPNLKIEVGGYTDNVGSLKANIKLSEERARAVANFLSENYGLNPERVLFKGYGPANPKAPNTTEEGRSQNRRVEIRFLEVI